MGAHRCGCCWRCRREGGYPSRRRCAVCQCAGVGGQCTAGYEEPRAGAQRRAHAHGRAGLSTARSRPRYNIAGLVADRLCRKPVLRAAWPPGHHARLGAECSACARARAGRICRRRYRADLGNRPAMDPGAARRIDRAERVEYRIDRVCPAALRAARARLALACMGGGDHGGPDRCRVAWHRHRGGLGPGGDAAGCRRGAAGRAFGRPCAGLLVGMARDQGRPGVRTQSLRRAVDRIRPRGRSAKWSRFSVRPGSVWVGAMRCWRSTA